MTEGEDVQDIWTTPEESDDPDPLAREEGEGDMWADEGGPPRRTVLIAQIALVVLVLIGVGVILVVKSNDNDKKSSDKTTQDAGKTGTDGKTTETTVKKKAQWPAAVNNRPVTLGKVNQKAGDVKSTAKPGVYIWISFDGWHIWAVGGAGMPPTITGSVASNAVFDRADLALAGSGTVTKVGKQANFSVPTDKPITGIDFNPGFFGNQLVVQLNGPDGPLDPKLVHLGGKAAPATFPLIIQKS